MRGLPLSKRLCFIFVVFLVFPTARLSAAQPIAPDSMRAGRFDTGRMWTFENPPIDYFEETYGFRPDSLWFAHARLSTLRLPGCSAAFVSPNGLVLTNHHCVRSKIDEASQDAEQLLDDGFYASALEDERPLDGYFAEQLIAIEDVTSSLSKVRAETDAERAAQRREITDHISQEIAARYGGPDHGIQVEIVSLYGGGLYSAYVYRRFDDVRLVMAPEFQVAFFGRSTDNFTYPQHSLDFSLLRIYDDGAPLSSDHYFPWTEDGVESGSLIFVIGNPGSTARLTTMAQLEYQRDVEVPATLSAIDQLVSVTQAHMTTHPSDARWMRTRLYSMLNAQKAYRGRLDALHDPRVMAKRRDAELQFRAALEGDSALMNRYAGVIDRLAEVQQRRREQADAVAAFAFLTHTTYSSSTIRRALLALQYLHLAQNGAIDRATAMKEELLAVRDQPEELEQHLIAVRLADFEEHFGAQSVLVRQALQGLTADARAKQLQKTSALAAAARTSTALEAGTLHEDPAVRLVEAFLPRLIAYQSAWFGLHAREQEIASELGQARLAVYGITAPPDATFSLRISDGQVVGYKANGTDVPPYTTFFGVYDKFNAHGPESEWDLPDRWHTPPASFDRATPLNFASTADTIGGSSGSPVINRDLELVGINFDRNFEGLSRDYIYLPERGRNISVDARAILESLDDIYKADRLVHELTTGRLVASEADVPDSSH